MALVPFEVRTGGPLRQRILRQPLWVPINQWADSSVADAPKPRTPAHPSQPEEKNPSVPTCPAEIPRGVIHARDRDLPVDHSRIGYELQG